MLHEWFVEEEFCDDDDEFPETFMREMVSQKGGKAILIFWRFNKQPFGISFYRRRFDVLIKLVGINDVDVMQEGKKYKFQKGMLEIKVWAHLEYDAEEKWRNNWFLKHLLDIYVKRLNAVEMDQHRQELLRDVESLQDVMKSYLNLLKHSDKRFDLKEVVTHKKDYV
jgi:hypothetical protein